jgi:hypothetical protein
MIDPIPCWFKREGPAELAVWEEGAVYAFLSHGYSPCAVVMAKLDGLTLSVPIGRLSLAKESPAITAEKLVEEEAKKAASEKKLTDHAHPMLKS